MKVSSPVGKHSVTLLPLKHKEQQMLKACLDRAIPMLVYEHTMDWKWCYCPQCHSILIREYMRYCDCCGQALTWHGSVKHAVRAAYR